MISKESLGHIRIHCGEAWACVILESSDFFENMMITLIKVEYIQRHPGDTQESQERLWSDPGASWIIIVDFQKI